MGFPSAEADQINVLLVDDDPDSFVLIRDMLRSSKTARFQVSYAERYEEGLSLLLNQPFDVALVDYRLGDGDGITFIREAAGRHCTLQVILLTGYPDEEIDLQAMRAGAADYLNKNEMTTALLERTVRYAYRRKQADDRNREIEAKLRYQAGLLANVRTPVVGTNAEIRITYWNRAAEVTFGWLEAEVLGRATQEVFKPVIMKIPREEALKSLLRDGHFAGEGLYLRKDGRQITVEVSSFALKDEQGTLLGFVSSLQDISERRQGEILRQSLNEINQTIHSTQNFDLVMQGAIREASAALGSDTAAVAFKDAAGGWTVRSACGFAQDMVGTRLEDDQERYAVLALQTKEPVTGSDVFKDGQPSEVRPVLAAPILIHNEGSGVIFFYYQHRAVQFTPAQIDFARKLGSALSLALENARLFQDLEREIQEHQRDEEALRVSEERFRLALLNSPITVFNQDLDLRYTWIYNPGYGFSVEEITGKTDQDLFTPEVAEKITAYKRQVIATGQPVRCELDFYANGQRAINDMTIEPLVQNGKIVGVKVVAVDIINLRLLQQQQADDRARIEIQRQLIEHRERERLQIARDLHDGPLQNLVCMTLTLKCLEDELADRPEVLPALGEYKNVLQQTISELRSYASELRPPALNKLGLEKAIESHLEGFKQRHPEIEVVFQVKQKGGILPEPVRTALYRIYQELMNNVVKHACASRVEITFRKDACQVILQVQDNGRGFLLPAEWVDLARQHHLGLVGTRERAEAVGGTIEIQSEPGQGTTVTVSVPAIGATPPAE